MDDALAELARRHGVAVEYWDQQGQWHGVAPETVVAVLAAVGVPAQDDAAVRASLVDSELRDWRRTLPPVYVHRQSRVGDIWVHVPHGAEIVAHIVTEDGDARSARQIDHLVAPRDVDGSLVGEASFEVPRDLPLGYHQFQVRAAGDVAFCPLIVTPDRLPEVPAGWGLMAQLYAARSRHSWGIGDLGDLDGLVRATAEAEGSFVLVNPMHAASPVEPLEPSPYLPVTRRFAHPIYLDLDPLIAATPLSADDRSRVETWAHEARTACATTIDWSAAWRAKRAALELLWETGAGDDGEFAEFVRSQGVALQDHALWCAIADDYGPRWQEWPQELRDVRGAAVTAEFAAREDRVLFHSWLQFLMAEQLRSVQTDARDRGMGIGVMHDLAVGVHADGADTWRLGHLLAADVSVGAPPDVYNAQGQNWAQPPWQPEALADAAFAPYRDMLAAVLRNAGGVRVDHILGLYRQWWIPDGMSPAAGTYVAVDHEAMVGILLLEAHRAGAVVVGEDLGTVADWIRDDMADRGILGTGVLWFERDGSGVRPPEWWRSSALASVTVHDLPPTAGYVAGTHLAVRDELGLVESLADEQAEHDRELAQWRELLVARGFLSPEESGVAPGNAEVDRMVTALYRCLAASPAVLVGVNLPDLAGDVRPQNQPGTHREYPNWCQPVSGPDTVPVLLDDPTALPLWRDITAVVRRR
ncbi:MAG: 4-alpha-glucanotransferase [Candidatus Nanopelagicales bacterium]